MNLRYTLAELSVMMQLPIPEKYAALTATGVSIDTRTLVPGDLFFALSGANYDADQFVDEAFRKGAVAAVTHGEHRDAPCFVTSAPQTSLRELAAKHRILHSVRVIAITGSCGKTTAKDMTASVLGEEPEVAKTVGNFNNDIGCPLSLLHINERSRYAVIEMGANHVGEIMQLCEIARPDESAVTLVAPAHLEGFGTLENVARAKAEIMEALPDSGCFYVNMDDPFCRAMGDAYSGEKMRFGREGDVRLENLDFDADGTMLLTIAPVGRLRLPLKVRAHANNVLLAVAVGLRHGITEFEAPLRQACKNTARFKTLDIHGIILFDDSYNANPASMAAALEALRDQSGGRKIAVLGDMFELGTAASGLHYALGEEAAKKGVAVLLARGAYADVVMQGARDHGLSDVHKIDDAEAAARLLRQLAQPGDVILIKGSRGMKMETVIEAFRKTFSGER